MSVYVIGGGGHAKVVIATLQAAGETVAGVLDDDAAKQGGSLLGVPVLGPVAMAGQGGYPAVIAVGDNTTRQRIAASLPEVEWVGAIHPAAVVHPSVRLGAGTVVFAGAVVQPDTEVGAHAIINTGATVDHDCRLGDYVHVAPGANLSGGVRLDEGVFLGIGARAIPGITVGEWTVVGAGAVVVQALPARCTAIGVPARPLRRP